MNSFWPSFYVFALALFLGYFFTKFIKILAWRYNILDQPKSNRKIHRQAIPLLGGWAIYLAFLLVVILLWQNNVLFDQYFSQTLLFWFFVSGAVLMLNGFLDDKYNLPAKITIWGPILATAIMLLAGLKITYVTNPSGGVLYLAQYGQFLGLLLTALWLLGMTYTTKLLDGVDGLASSISLIATVIIFLVSLSWDVKGSTTSILTLILVGVILGFLFWNWHPAKIFLGEAGSTFLGFSLGVLSIISGSKIATALLVMGLPVLDIVVVIIRRLKKHQSIWIADQEHLHFRLLSSGLSQRQVVLLLSLISLLFGLIAVFVHTKTKIFSLLFLLLLMLILSWRLNNRLKKQAHEEV